MNQTKEKKLKKIAKNIRLGILEEVHAASSGHPGGSLSIADILAYLYWEEMNVRPDEPDWADRDRLVLSKGHTAPAIYAALAVALRLRPVAELAGMLLPRVRKVLPRLAAPVEWMQRRCSA